MTLDALMRAVPPPEKPREAGSGRSWLEVEVALGTTLPTDYKGYINLYGTGELGGCIWVYNPFSDIRHGQNLLVRVPEVLNIWRSKRARAGEEEYLYPLYPEPNGLLPWGHVDTGAELFWLTSGAPDEWTVVVNEARGPHFQEFNESMTGFLVSLFAGRLRSDILPRSLMQKKTRVSFIPLIE